MSVVRLSSPDKVLWPATEHTPARTKRDLAEWLEVAADRLLVHLRDRPLSVKRYPRGITAEGFFQKNLPDHAPDSIERFRVWADTADREVAYAVVDDAEDLAWFAQQNTIEFHPAIARTDQPERPDRLVIDIDPGPNEVPVGRIARWVREVMVELGTDPLVTTSGGRGMHLVVPIERDDIADLRAVVLAVCRMVVDRHPDELTIEFSKKERGGRTLLDWSRTSPGATLAAPFSPRARAGATVATPLHWDEVDDDLDPTGFTMDTVCDREDPWNLPQHTPQPLASIRDAVVDAGMDLVDISPRGGTTADKLDD